MNPNLYHLMKKAGYHSPHLAKRAQDLVDLTVQEIIEILQSYPNHYWITQHINQHFKNV